jgi:hypothetical protein
MCLALAEDCVDKYPDLIFIASLWSGRSRLAFRTVVDAMSKLKFCRMQLIDSDTLVGQVLFGLLPTEHHGNGILIAFENGHFRFIGSGLDLEHLKENLAEVRFEGAGRESDQRCQEP